MSNTTDKQAIRGGEEFVDKLKENEGEDEEDEADSETEDE